MSPVLHALPESRRPRRRSTGGMAASVVLHAALIGVAVVATARAGVAPPRPPETLVYVPAPPPPAAQRVGAPPRDA
ncbi:hypothetical protein PYV61_21535, partial [Roseisolibacter sp. H3M3-2]